MIIITTHMIIITTHMIIITTHMIMITTYMIAQCLLRLPRPDQRLHRRGCSLTIYWSEK